MTSIRASHVVIAQLGEVRGELVHMNSVNGRDCLVALQGERFVIEGTGLTKSYSLAEVRQAGVTPDGSRFGLMAPGDVEGLLVPSPGMHMVRIDAKKLGGPKKPALQAFGQAVIAAVRQAGGRVE